MNFNNQAEVNVNVIGQAADGSRHELQLIETVGHPMRRGLSALVRLPDVKADPELVAQLKAQLEMQAGMMKSMADEIEQWKKRFDALLFQKGGAA